MITLETLCDPIARRTLEQQVARYRAMPPQRAKWFLNSLHLHGKLSGTDLAYWLSALDINPSL